MRKCVIINFGVLLLLFGCAEWVPSATTVEDEEQYAALDKVNLRKKGLTVIPDFVFENKDVKILKLYGNKLETISERIGELTSLEELYIGKNNLKSLPASIGKLKNLKILSLQYNEIDSLPESIGQLENLEQLILNQNKIKHLPASIGNLKKLSVLQLKFNELETLPNEIGDCEELQFIYLNRNQLKRIPDELSKCRKLKEIWVSGAGPLLNLPESLCELRLLDILEIDLTIVVPTCLLVQKTTRLQIIQN